MGALNDESGTGHRSRTCTASLTAESKTQQKPWQMQMAESSGSNSAAERVVWTPSNLKSPVWKYFGFWSVDGKNAEPWDEVVCKLCKLQLAYHSTTSNMRAPLENVHPNDHDLQSESLLARASESFSKSGTEVPYHEPWNNHQ